MTLMPISSLVIIPALLAEGAPANPLAQFGFLWPIVIIGILFYFMLIRPEKRKQADVTRMQQGLKKNDRVVTIGGIIGVVVNTQQGSEEVTIRVDENTNTRLRVVRSAISRVLSSDKVEDDTDAAKS